MKDNYLRLALIVSLLQAKCDLDQGMDAFELKGLQLVLEDSLDRPEETV